MMLEIRILSMMRSGHHAICNWIFEQLSGNSLFINRIDGKVNYFIHSDFCSWKPDHMIFNFEDLSVLQHNMTIKKIKHVYDLGPKFKNVLVLRDPFNLFASRLQMKKIIEKNCKNTTSPVGEFTKEAFALWKNHAFEFLNSSNHLTNKICINYNTWCVSKNYREKIASQLGLEFTDLGFDTVPVFGGGSSFDGMTFDGLAQKMDVFQRYKHYIDFEWFQSQFDYEIKKLSQEIFEFQPL
jgi:hypothetical protein